MCDRNDSPHADHHREGEEITAGEFSPLGNLRASGMPWHRLVVAVIANNWRKLRTGQGCCGNLGQPGC